MYLTTQDTQPLKDYMEDVFECVACKETKNKSEFYKRTSRPKGVSSNCKLCEKKRYNNYVKHNKEKRVTITNNWKSNNPEKVKAYWRKYNKETSEKLSAILRPLKDKPCMDCNQSYPYYVMDFDHRDPSTKVACVGHIHKFRTEEKLLKEIEKCDLVCSNCHRVRTYKRNHSEE